MKYKGTCEKSINESKKYKGNIKENKRNQHVVFMFSSAVGGVFQLSVTASCKGKYRKIEKRKKENLEK